ncbi:MAG: hypothetical protein Q7S53_00385 [bacterium]|nr:hypothetical protein [bacterium]
MPQAASQTSVFGNKVSKKWLIFLAFALGSVITVAVSYLAITSYMERNAAPAYYAEMAGKYCTDAKLAGEKTEDPCIELLENGRISTRLHYSQQGGWSWKLMNPNFGEWSMNGNTITLELESICKLEVVGNTLYDTQRGVSFQRK